MDLSCAAQGVERPRADVMTHDPDPPRPRGAPLKTPGDPRSMWSGRLPSSDIAYLRATATRDLTQSDIVSEALALRRRNLSRRR